MDTVTRHCVVIGAGIVGACLAARLAASGTQVTLLDAGQPGRDTSRWSYAWLNSNDKAPRHYHDLNQAGIRAWGGLAQDLDGAAWYRPVGHVELATSQAASTELAARVRRLTEWGYPARLVTPAQACELEPSLKPPPPGTAAAWFPEEGYLVTGPLIARLVAEAAAHGAQILTGDQGRVVAVDGTAPRVRTAAGGVLEPDQVVCCAGRRTTELIPQVPLIPWDTPGSAAPALVVRAGPAEPAGPAPVRLLHTPGLALRPHPDGQVQLEAPDVPVDLHTTEPELHRAAAGLLDRARQAVHGLDRAQITERHVCVRPIPRDGHPVVGPVPGAPALYVAVTHSGVTLAAHLAALVTAELATGTPPGELAPYRPERFHLSRTTPWFPLPAPAAVPPSGRATMVHRGRDSGSNGPSSPLKHAGRRPPASPGAAAPAP